LGRDRRRLRSWMNRAPSPIAACTTFRKLGHGRQRPGHGVRQSWATTSATGVAFTRNPSTGDKKLYGEFLVNAQGEDVVAGIRTPQNITEAARIEAGSDKPSLEKGDAGGVCTQFAASRSAREALPRHAGPRIHHRARQAVDAADALGQAHGQGGAEDRRRHGRRRPDQPGGGGARIDPASLDQLLHPTIDPQGRARRHRHPACRPRRARRRARSSSRPTRPRTAGEGRKVILVRVETSPEDIHGMHAAEGILTTRGGMTSHAAVVARGMGKPCVSGAGSLRVDYRAGTLVAAWHTLKQGRRHHHRRLDRPGAEGRGADAQAGTVGRLRRIMEWADQHPPHEGAHQCRDAGRCPHGAILRRRGHRALPHRAHVLRGDRIVAMREMILSDTKPAAAPRLPSSCPCSAPDFASCSRSWHGLPVTIRLLDPPLHEFLPQSDEEIAEVAAAMNVEAEEAAPRAPIRCTSSIPCSAIAAAGLPVSYPEIAEMQARAIFEAAAEAAKKTGAAGRAGDHGAAGRPQGGAGFRQGAHRCGRQGGDRRKPASTIDYLVGTMIELPRAAFAPM
jgi:pyruvate,orthophosphate dikinase